MGWTPRALKLWWRAATGITLAAFALDALAAAFAHQSKSEKWTEPAGQKTESSVELVTTADYYGLQTLKLWQNDERICKLQIEQGSFNTRSVGVLEAVKVCEPKSSESWKRADLGSGQFVTGISICTGQGKDAGPALLGVELTGATLEESGKPRPVAPVKAEFPGCRKWSPRRQCPSGSIATGLRAYTPDEEQGVVGIALRCHKLEPR